MDTHSFSGFSIQNTYKKTNKEFNYHHLTEQDCNVGNEDPRPSSLFSSVSDSGVRAFSCSSVGRVVVAVSQANEDPLCGSVSLSNVIVDKSSSSSGSQLAPAGGWTRAACILCLKFWRNNRIDGFLSNLGHKMFLEKNVNDIRLYF